MHLFLLLYAAVSLNFNRGVIPVGEALLTNSNRQGFIITMPYGMDEGIRLYD